jgi:hypothetical protein
MIASSKCRHPRGTILPELCKIVVPPIEEGAGKAGYRRTMSRLVRAARHDAFRAMLEIGMCVALPQEVMARPYVARPYVAAKMAEFERHVLPPDPGIDRDQLMSLLDGRTDVSSVPRPVATQQRASRVGAR